MKTHKDLPTSGHKPTIKNPPAPSSKTSPRSSATTPLYPAPLPLRECGNVQEEEDYLDPESPRLVIDFDPESDGVTSPKGVVLPASNALPAGSALKMNAIGTPSSLTKKEQHEAIGDTGLKMKIIKRKSLAPGSSKESSSGTSSSSSSSNANTIGKNTESSHESRTQENKTQENNGVRVSPSGGINTMVQNSPPQTTMTPFEGIRKALELQQESKKLAKSQQAAGPNVTKWIGKKSPLSGPSVTSVTIGSPSGNPSGYTLNGVIGDGDRSTGGSQKTGNSCNDIDPYAFDAKVEDSRAMGFPVSKKLKMEKTDMESSVNTSVCMAAFEKAVVQHVSGHVSGHADCKKEAHLIKKMIDGSTSIEEQLLGPLQSGSPLTLKGVINEETTGMLLVNVTWKGKTYVGTLIDTTSYAPPIPPPEPQETEPTRVATRPGRGKNGKSGRQTANSQVGRGRNTRSTINSQAAAAAAAPGFAVPTSVPAASPMKCGEGTTIATKRHQSSEGVEEEAPPAKRTRSGGVNGSMDEHAPEEPTPGEDGYLLCPDEVCQKKFTTRVGLSSHMDTAHTEHLLRKEHGEEADQSKKSLEMHKKEKKKKKKKGKKAPEHGSSQDEDTSDVFNNTDIAVTINGLGVTSVVKTVTAPIATVPMASNENCPDLMAITSKRSKDKSDKKSKKKKKDKNREKKQHEQQPNQESEQQSHHHNADEKSFDIPMDTMKTKPSDTQPCASHFHHSPEKHREEKQAEAAYSDISDEEKADTSPRKDLALQNNPLPMPRGLGPLQLNAEYHSQPAVINLTKDKGHEPMDVSQSPAAKDPQHPREGATSSERGTTVTHTQPAYAPQPVVYPEGDKEEQLSKDYGRAYRQSLRENNLPQSEQSHENRQVKSSSIELQSFHNKSNEPEGSRSSNPQQHMQAVLPENVPEGLRNAQDHEQYRAHLFRAIRASQPSMPEDQVWNIVFQQEMYQQHALQQQQRALQVSATSSHSPQSSTSSPHNHVKKEQRQNSPASISSKDSSVREERGASQDRHRAPEVRRSELARRSPSPRRTPPISSQQQRKGTQSETTSTINSHNQQRTSSAQSGSANSTPQVSSAPHAYRQGIPSPYYAYPATLTHSMFGLGPGMYSQLAGLPHGYPPPSFVAQMAPPQSQELHRASLQMQQKDRAQEEREYQQQRETREQSHHHREPLNVQRELLHHSPSSQGSSSSASRLPLQMAQQSQFYFPGTLPSPRHPK